MVSVLLAIVLVLGLEVGPPSSPPPDVGGTIGAPPPAWIDSGRRSRWLAYGTYCWRTACVDMLPPESRPEPPRIKVRPGQTLWVHLAFTPGRASVQVLQAGTSVTLASTGRRTLTFRARRGVLIVSAMGFRGSASYIARLVS